MPPSLQKLLLTENRDRLQAALADRYRLDRELGRGGMATVFLAQDLRHDRPVALKVLHPELAASLGPERFLREIRLAARLQHPHILTVHDSGEAVGQLWFTMPYVEGESLRQLLTRQKQLPVADALRIAREASLALEYAHRHGVIHRDIKPENLLLTTDGSTLVADFGIARALGGASDQLTETGMAVGTPAYMSPEQASGGRDLDARTDVYSLGAVLYEMLTGEPPFTGPTAQAVIVKRFSGEVPRIRLTRAAVPEAVEQAVTKALQLLPADRHATAAEFAQALTATTPSSDRENAPVGRVSRRRIPLAFALGIGFIVGLGVLFAWRKGRGGSEAAGGPKLLAVLPFENLGGPEDEYFADGMTDAVRGKLAGLTGLRVISRGSTGQYKKSTKSPTQIGQELGVQYLLTARIRWEKVVGGASRVQVSPELIEVSDATTRWQQPFDAQLSDVFQVQGQIASQVAQALNVALAATERQQLAERPTASLAAYDAFLQGEEASGGMGTPGALALRRAAGAYEQAVALDSGFAIAWARLSEAYALNYANTSSGADAERARFAAERAVALAPGRPEGHLALGKYYEYVRFDYGRALEEFGLGQRAAPNNANLLTAIAAAEQSLGKWEASLEHLRQAETLDPRSVLTARRIARALLFLRRYVEALAASNRALALAPANPDILETKAMVYLAQGDLADARAVLQPP